MTDPAMSTFQRKLQERKEQLALEQAVRERANDLSTLSDVIPEAPYEATDTDREMDRIVGNIDIIDAYSRWCGKMRPVVRSGQTESIMVSCPVPGHADKKPSAWINTDKQTWFCASCQQGGDAHDLAAYHFGYSVPNYKQGSDFHKLRIQMAGDYGYRLETLPGDVKVLSSPEDDPLGLVSGIPDTPEQNGHAPEVVAAETAPLNTSAPEKTLEKGVVTAPEPKTQPEEDKPEAQVVDLFEPEEEFLFSPLDWKPVAPDGTFIGEYMKAAVVDDVPEEYHFFSALVALGFACGRDARLDDGNPVFGNLFVCTLGPSGSGKSRARGHLDDLLATALPHDWNDPLSKGVRRVSAPGSAEVLIQNFQKAVEDPINPKIVAYYAPVRGIIDFSELSSLVGRTNRTGSVMIPTLMQFYDMDRLIATSSMGTGTKEAHWPFASAFTTTQPKSLKNLISKQDASSGFLNRWVFVPGTYKKKLAIGRVSVDMTDAAIKLQEVIGWASAFNPSDLVTWSEDAAALFTKFFHETVEKDKRDDQSDMLTRMDLLMKKLVLLFTANRRLREVPVESVRDAISLYTYLIDAYSIPAGQLGTSLASEVADAIISVTKKQFDLNGQGVSLSHISRSLWRRKYPLDLLLKTADSLTKLDFLKAEQPNTGRVGRPVVKYKYVSDAS